MKDSQYLNQTGGTKLVIDVRIYLGKVKLGWFRNKTEGKGF